MGKDNRQKLRELAEELANVEANIFVLRDFSPGNPRHEQKEAAQIGNPPKNGMTSWIAGTVAAALLLPPVALYTGYRAYQANKVYKKKLQEWQDDQKVQNNLKEMVIHQENRRKEILEDIQKLCAADPMLDKNYWWKAKEVTPTMGDAVEALLPGKEVTVGEWQFGLLHQFWTVESGAYLYLLDMKKYSVNLCAKDAMEMADPANSKIIYKNNRLLNEKAEGFRLMHFYAYHVEPIQEVRKSTVRTAVDKEAERRAYQRKLDIQESILNGIGSRNFMTDEEMQLTGRIGTGEYVDRNLVRGMFEADFEQKLAARGDYEEHSTYSKSFRGLSSIVLYNCADTAAFVNGYAHLIGGGPFVDVLPDLSRKKGWNLIWMSADKGCMSALHFLADLFNSDCRQEVCDSHAYFYRSSSDPQAVAHQLIDLLELSAKKGDPGALHRAKALADDRR